MTKVPEKVREAYRELPPNWKLEKLKFFADVRNSNVDKTISEHEEPVRLCNYTDVYYNDRITPDLHFMEGSATEAEIERFQLKRGQVIITKDSEEWDDIGIPALITKDMPEVLCGYHLSVFEPGPDLDGGFLAWLCRAEPLNGQFKLAANGVTRFGLGQYPMKNAFIVLPPLDTQRRIAQFLDEKTARIDGLIAKKRELLALLAEKRQALITHAVTKGLDLNSLMKSPGIDLLGGMTSNEFLQPTTHPAEWESIRLRWLSKRYAGGTPDTKNAAYWEDGTIPWLNSGAVNQGIITKPSGYITELALKESSAKWIPRGALVIALAGQGKTKAMVGYLDIRTTGNQSLAAVLPEKINGKFLYWWLSSQYLTLRNLSSQDGRDGLNLDMIGSIVCPVPPPDMQRRIARFLDEKTAQIDGLIDKIEESQNLLEEYRSALITQAVTGQLAKL